MKTILLLGLLAPQDEVWKSLSLGDRVQVTFRSGNAITGMLTVVPRDPKVKITSVDYVKETALTLDVSWEYPGLNGTMTIAKKEIREVRKLQNLDPKIIEDLKKQKDRVKKELDEQNKRNQEANEKRDREAVEAAAKVEKERREQELTGDDIKRMEVEAEGLKKGYEVLRKYPPPEWSPERLKDIGLKSQRRQPLSEAERDFMATFEHWMKAFQHRSKQEQEKKKEAPPEEKK
jgi:hypothetical protein